MPNDIQPPYLSVIIPAYNEQYRIADTLYAVKDYLADKPYRSEIIVVDDGSQDLTSEIVKFIASYQQEVNHHSTGVLLQNIKNVGKGFSVARGMIEAKGEVILFCDADMATPFQEIDRFLRLLESNNYDIVIGSRAMPDSVVEARSFGRKLMSLGLNSLVKLLSFSGIRDTQCGFKAYRQSVARQIASLQKIYGFGFDVEHLYIAHRLGYRIHEVGVVWYDRPGSTVEPWRDTLLMLIDLLRIRYLHRDLGNT